MGKLNYEASVISATLYYYDVDYCSSTSERVLHILKKYDMYPPQKIHAGILTRNRFTSADESTDSLFIQAYSTKNVFGVDMTNGDHPLASDFWRFSWGFTYYKNSTIVGSGKFRPWNTITLQSTYANLQKKSSEISFINCVKSLIEAVSPFYASIDDLSNKINLQNRFGEQSFIPDRICTVYWGNYFGESHANNFGREKLVNLPVYRCERLGDGFYFTLSDSLHEWDSKETEHARKKAMKHLQIK